MNDKTEDPPVWRELRDSIMLLGAVALLAAIVLVASQLTTAIAR